MIRPVLAEDIPQLAQLHVRTLSGGHTPQDVLAAYRAQFSPMFLESPWEQEPIPSLLYEDSAGNVKGLQAVATRTMLFKGERIRVAVPSRLNVEQDVRSTLVGLQLLKTCLSGPQDLSICDLANPASRKLLEALGGTSMPLYSLHWMRLLRPLRFALSRIGGRPRLAPFAKVASPVAALLDRFAGGLRKNPLRIVPPALSSEPLTPDLFQSHLSQFLQRETLVPCYDRKSVRWIWWRMNHMSDSGTVHKIAVRDEQSTLIGWFIYHLDGGGIGAVYQIAATARNVSQVLSHLFWHAWSQGAVVLTGRVHPPFLEALSEQRCLLYRRHESVVAHSRDPELLRPFERGEVFLSELEGEGCLYLGVRPNHNSRCDYRFDSGVDSVVKSPQERFESVGTPA